MMKVPGPSNDAKAHAKPAHYKTYSGRSHEVDEDQKHISRQDCDCAVCSSVAALSPACFSEVKLRGTPRDIAAAIVKYLGRGKCEQHLKHAKESKSRGKGK